MSIANIETFTEKVASDPALHAKLSAGKVNDYVSSAAFIDSAVKEARALGLEFSEGEFNAWLVRAAIWALRNKHLAASSSGRKAQTS